MGVAVAGAVAEAVRVAVAVAATVAAAGAPMIDWHVAATNFRLTIRAREARKATSHYSERPLPGCPAPWFPPPLVGRENHQGVC